MYISEFVVRRAAKTLACDVCCLSLLTDAASALKDQNYHLLRLKNNGGLVIPSEGTARVIRAAEWSFARLSQPISPLKLLYVVRKRIGSEDVLAFGQHGIEKHHHMLLKVVVSLFYKLRFSPHLAYGTTALDKNTITACFSKSIGHPKMWSSIM